MPLNEGWASITQDGTFSRAGVDHFHSVVIKRKDNILVVKQDGGTYWTGIGMERGRVGAEYQVWSIQEEAEPDRVRVKLLIDFPVRKIKEVV